LALLDAGDEDFVATPITSQTRNTEFDLPFQKWREAGPNVASTARIHKLTVLAKNEIVRRVGTLSDQDREALLLTMAIGRRLPIRRNGDGEETPSRSLNPDH
jgi:mRNA-degrading endonuclease toxin of MazEF toxin-antitoxin module